MTCFYTNVAVHRDKILVRSVEYGKKYKSEVPYKPYCFLPSKKETGYKTLEGNNVDIHYFADIWEARRFYKEKRDLPNFNYYGMEKFEYTYIHDQYPEEIKYDPKAVTVAVIDIEVDSKGGFPKGTVERADRTITAISMQNLHTGLTLCFGLKDVEIDIPDAKYIFCESERELIQLFLKHWRRWDVDVVTGWNIQSFDIPYLVNRIANVLGLEFAEKLSPWNILKEDRNFVMGKEQITYVPVGISVLDYLPLYVKFAYTRPGQDSFKESKKLDYIANKELGEKKVDYSEYGSLNGLYEQNPKLFYEYNIHDCTLVSRLEKKLRFLELIYRIAYDAHVNYADALTTVRLWDVIIYNFLMNKGIVIPKPSNNPQRQLMGGVVKPTQIGKHEHIVSLDVTSLYPHLIIAYNISPETYVGKVHSLTIQELMDGKFVIEDPDLAVAANGCAYRKDKQGFLGALMEQKFNQRKSIKKLKLKAEEENTTNPSSDLEDQIIQYDGAQLAIKIMINSAYGALGNPTFRYYDINHAEAITCTGQFAIQWSEKHVNQYINSLVKPPQPIDVVIAMDTDSNIFTVKPLIDKVMPNEKNLDNIINFIDKFVQTKLEPKLKTWFTDFCTYTNAYKDCISMKREMIADKGIWVAKKRYVCNVWDSEGVRYKTPKLKIKGLEIVKSSTPEICRTRLEEAVRIMLNKDLKSLREFIKAFREEYKTLPYEASARPMSVNNLDKYFDPVNRFKKGTPKQVKGALIYNELLAKHKLDLTQIFNGDKIKFASLKMPNPTFIDVISCPGDLPKEFGLEKYIDYDELFEKSFLKPLRLMCNAIQWDINSKPSILKFGKKSKS